MYSKKRIIIPLFMSFVLLVGTLGGTLNVKAAPSDKASNLNDGLQVDDSIMEIEDEDLIQTVESYVTVENNRFELNNVKELKSEVGEEDYEKVKQQMDNINKKLAESKQEFLSADNDGITYTVPNKEVKQKLKDAGENDLAAKINDRGVNKIKWHVFTVEIWLSHDTIQAIIIATTAAASTILIALFPSLIAKAATAAAAALIIFYSGKIAKPHYIKMSWFGSIKESHSY